MSFWDNVKKFTQPYSDEEYDDYDEEAEDYAPEQTTRTSRRNAFSDTQTDDPAPAFDSAPAASVTSTTSGFSGQVLNTSSGSKQEVILFHAKAFDDAAKAADDLHSRKAVILNMENVDKALTRRVVDFLTGCVYALDGKVKKVAQATYLFCPHGMDIVGDLENSQGEVESYL